ncbi:MAG TPA: hypothetical protein VM307_03035, partial [Egibacteraceae bacterium]|nr:hypothetical protein [Egibacteraceae bacterium]
MRFPPPAGLAAYGVLAAAVTVLTAAGVLPQWPGVLHLVALPPLDVFADTRLLVTRAPSYGWFAGGLVVSAAVRITVWALLAGERGRPAS